MKLKNVEYNVFMFFVYFMQQYSELVTYISFLRCPYTRIQSCLTHMLILKRINGDMGTRLWKVIILLSTRYYWDDQVKEDKTDEPCSMHGGD
jgi:hypothetical protein